MRPARKGDRIHISEAHIYVSSDVGCRGIRGSFRASAGIEVLVVDPLGLLQQSLRQPGDGLHRGEEWFAVGPAPRFAAGERPREASRVLLPEMPVLAELTCEPVPEGPGPPRLGAERVHRQPGKFEPTLGVDAVATHVELRT